MALLENIRVFVRAVELGSLSAAGRQLRLAPAVASQRLQQLETHLGARLVQRTTRSLTATEAGRAFYAACQDILDAVDRAEGALAEAGGTPSGAIRISAPLGLGRRVLAPLVARFAEEHPRISVRLRLSDHLLDLVREGIDLSLRLGVLEESTLIARHIADFPRVLCASADYLRAHGTPEAPGDLLMHECLLLRSPGMQQVQWRLMHGGTPFVLPITGRMDADDGDVLTAWALSGRGIVLKPLFEVAAELERGMLVRVLPRAELAPAGLALVYPNRRLMPTRTRLLADFLIARLEAAVRAVY